MIEPAAGELRFLRYQEITLGTKVPALIAAGDSE
jgi:hypothetical protein